MANLIYAKRVKAVIHDVNTKVLVTRQYLEQLEDDLKRRITKHAEINGDGYIREIPIEAQLNGAPSVDKKTAGSSREQIPQEEQTEEPTLEDDDKQEFAVSSNRTTKCPECGGPIKLKDVNCPKCGCCMVCKEEPCECKSLCEVCEKNPCECEEPEL